MNYLPEAFGLTSFYHLPVEKESKNEEGKVVELHPRQRNRIRQYAAAAAIGAVIASSFWIALNQNKLGINYSNLNFFAKKDVKQYSLIQRTPMPPTPNVKDSVAVAFPKPVPNNQPGNFHIVAGCFKYMENAQGLIKKMQQQSISVSIIGITAQGLYIVGYGKFITREEAELSLSNFRKNYQADAWVFEKAEKM